MKLRKETFILVVIVWTKIKLLKNFVLGFVVGLLKMKVNRIVFVVALCERDRSNFNRYFQFMVY